VALVKAYAIPINIYFFFLNGEVQIILSSHILNCPIMPRTPPCFFPDIPQQTQTRSDFLSVHTNIHKFVFSFRTGFFFLNILFIHVHVITQISFLFIWVVFQCKCFLLNLFTYYIIDIWVFPVWGYWE
jgi:hypothetical protein